MSGTPGSISNNTWSFKNMQFGIFVLKYLKINPIISCPTREENVVSTFRIRIPKLPIKTFEIFSQYKSLHLKPEVTCVYNILTGFACI